MKFGIFYEHQHPRPWSENSEQTLFDNALDQVELADKVGIDYVWEVEHHFLEEYSHSSAPEVFLAACSQRTKNIRLGHGVVLTAPGYNHPARTAERIATLDLVSRGRVEWGTGESATMVEMEGFNISAAEKAVMWREGTEQAANMLAMTPYPGFKGQYFSMPTRNLVPKPAQKPHPPMWLACSRRESIHRAARAGMGALTFAFIEPELAGTWVKEYYDIIKSEECVPIGHTVNPNIAVVSAMSCHPVENEAIARGLDGFRFFGYSLGYYGIFSAHKPGVTDVWQEYLKVRDTLPDNAGRGGIGTPEQVAAHIRRYENVGIDQVIFVQQSGNNRHEHICDSLRVFGRDVLPEFKAREIERAKKKEAELAPYIAAALARKPRMKALDPADVETVLASGRRQGEVSARAAVTFSDRGGAISIPTADPALEKAYAEGRR